MELKGEYALESVDWITHSPFVLGDSLDTISKREEENKRREEAVRNVQKELASPSYENAEVTKLYRTNEQCVVFAKRITGISASIGYAGRALPEGKTPKVNSIGLEVKFGHAFVVEEIRDDGVLALEANYVKGWANTRFIPYSDIKGYLYKE